MPESKIDKLSEQIKSIADSLIPDILPSKKPKLLRVSLSPDLIRKLNEGKILRFNADGTEIEIKLKN